MYTDAALSEPVVLTRNGRDRLVVASVDDFREILSLAVLNAGGDTELAALAKALQAISEAPVPSATSSAKKRA
jgi:PHD/YefM family antitoxin component YafN of YafNO toxin-antitoxin module